jgi:hypothetical protein
VSGLHHVELCPRSLRYYTTDAESRRGGACRPCVGWRHSILGKFRRSATSALGQKRTSAHVRIMSALPPKADIEPSRWKQPSPPRLWRAAWPPMPLRLPRGQHPDLKPGQSPKRPRGRLRSRRQSGRHQPRASRNPFRRSSVSAS